MIVYSVYIYISLSLFQSLLLFQYLKYQVKIDQISHQLK